MDNPTPFSFAISDVARACRIWGPELQMYTPKPIDPVQLMWAFANNESTHERLGFLGCVPRYEPAYDVGGRYGDTPAMAGLLKYFGKDAAKSYGPWQVMYCNAAKWRPQDFQYLDICADAFVAYMSDRCRIHRPQTLEAFGQLYNSGHIVARPAVPIAQVQQYCARLAECYKIPLPPEGA